MCAFNRMPITLYARTLFHIHPAIYTLPSQQGKTGWQSLEASVYHVRISLNLPCHGLSGHLAWQLQQGNHTTCAMHGSIQPSYAQRVCKPDQRQVRHHMRYAANCLHDISTLTHSTGLPVEVVDPHDTDWSCHPPTPLPDPQCSPLILSLHRPHGSTLYQNQAAADLNFTANLLCFKQPEPWDFVAFPACLAATAWWGRAFSSSPCSHSNHTNSSPPWPFTALLSLAPFGQRSLTGMMCHCAT